MGDLKALAASIKAVGLLQPIGVTPDLRLVFGERRPRATIDGAKTAADNSVVPIEGKVK